MIKRRNFHSLLAAAALAAAGLAQAQAPYPDHAIKLIVPFPPGGNIDATARIVANGLSEKLGQTVIVDNRPGAAGLLGSEVAARSPADGYTLLLASTGVLAPAKALTPDMKLDPARDFVAVSPIAQAPLLLIVNPSLPVNSVAEFIAYAKAHPGKVSIASPGTGTAAHLTAELFQKASGTQLLHVPYKGSSQAVADLLGGQVNATFDQLASTLAQIKAGKLKALGITTAQRSAIVPQIPTLAESGLPGFESSTTTGLVVPAGTPPAVVAKLSAAMQEVLKSPEARQKFEVLGSDVVAGPGSEYDGILKSEVRKWTQVVKDAGIKLP
ncbi:tripartite tricarboxylate transporter substrate binding protein [Xylophilus rhododendri]|uniref:Tripartite tricarboxylate transporter substrate binding protein n=1 Tax=Xylophilus rhododendri TaxID=2697032 RepID=A0A857JDI7_9BURK|nr:tripartite tricarboxylate transporter substrate binding protein [Xylophilus rhododendri]QHJ01274.1 tripartite tricarboxylate transporter substrate binding protein [Xylophilus rhododendri]